MMILERPVVQGKVRSLPPAAHKSPTDPIDFGLGDHPDLWSQTPAGVRHRLLLGDLLLMSVCVCVCNAHTCVYVFLCVCMCVCVCVCVCVVEYHMHSSSHLCLLEK